MALGDLIDKVLSFDGVGEEGKKLAKRLKETFSDPKTAEQQAGLINRLFDHIEQKGKEE